MQNAPFFKSFLGNRLLIFSTRWFSIGAAENQTTQTTPQILLHGEVFHPTEPIKVRCLYGPDSLLPSATTLSTQWQTLGLSQNIGHF